MTKIENNKQIIKKLKIKEIEFYFKDDNHPDPFVHGSEEQKTPGNWYFHKKGNSYKEGSFKGLDITFGPKNNNSYGGILIRTLKEDSNKTLEGPCVCVNYIIDFFGFHKVKDFAENLDSFLLDSNKINLSLEDIKTNEVKIYEGPKKSII